VPGSENAKLLAATMEAVAKEKWGAKAAGILSELKSKGRVAYKEAPLSKDGEVYDGFEGMHSLNASSQQRPAVIDRDTTVLTPADGRPYGGCYVDAQHRHLGAGQLVGQAHQREAALGAVPQRRRRLLRRRAGQPGRVPEHRRGRQAGDLV
jgi:hypothetical protein